MEQYNDAIRDCSEALRADPTSADALFVRGLAWRRLHRTSESDADIASAEANDPKVVETYDGYGVTP